MLFLSVLYDDDDDDTTIPDNERQQEASEALEIDGKFHYETLMTCQGKDPDGEKNPTTLHSQ